MQTNKTNLCLPFEGEWFVFWGGDRLEINPHMRITNQMFAYDLVIMNECQKTYRNEGKVNEDYYAFGRDILAPADGVVTDVINGIRENVPGARNPDLVTGNAVFIQHINDEVSILAHLKLGSIKVKVGDKVKKGDVIGQCGNSGNSTEPHLHYHLQNTPIFQDGIGIKCYFEDIVVIKNGKEVKKARYSPVKGDIVAQVQER